MTACKSDRPPSPTGAELDVVRYDLKGDYDWDRGRLVATVGVTLVPAGDGTKIIALDSAVTEVKAVRLAGGGALPFSTDSAAKELRVDISSVPNLSSDAALTLEIDDEAEPGDSLVAVLGRKGDPLKDVRAVFTMSEPLGAEHWMPCHDTPSDRGRRARFIRASPRSARPRPRHFGRVTLDAVLETENAARERVDLAD
jgi:aminopeptidase N